MPDGASGGAGSGLKEAEGAGTLSMLLQELARAPGGDLYLAWQQRLHPGEVVGRFEILREIGRGGFGVVYEALDRQLGRSVAFKTLRPARSGQELSADWILKEAEAVARLEHPAIVTLHEVGRCESGPYLVEELLRGQTLEGRLRGGPLPADRALAVGLELARGLAHAHGRGVLHRDLKPGNVFLTEDGRVKLLDFGLAHLLGTRGLPGAGTPAYMAPEQLRGEAVDARADVFALGATLFEVLAGKAPFEVKEGRSAALDDGPPPALLEGTPGLLAALVYRCLSRDPAKRPASGQAVVEELLAVQRALERAGLDNRVASTGTPDPRSNLRFALLLVGAAAIVAGGTYLVATRFRSATDIPAAASVPPALPSVAVLPFADMSPGKDQEYFADGVAEEILNALVQVEGLRVAGRSSSFAYKGKNEKVQDMGRALHVGAVLEGSVRKAGHRVRIAAELVATADGFHLWSHSYERDMTDVFAVQDDIAHAVVGALQVKLLPGRSVGAREHLATHPDAYSQYLLGRQLYHLGSPEGYRSAVDAYEKALAIDPKYAPAWAGLAVAANYASNFAVSGDEFERFVRRSREAGPKSAEFDPDFADGFAARGYVRAMLHHDWTGAAEDMERAISLSPRDAEIRRLYGSFVLQPQGRLTQAIESARLATELDPGAPLCWNSLGFALMQAGLYESARAAFEETLRLNPDQSFAALNLVKALVLEGDAARALPIAEGAISPGRRLTALAIVHHSLEHADESRKALEALIAEFGNRTPYQIATVYAWRGERDPAFVWLERAMASSDREIFLAMKVDRMLRALHGDARFVSLLRRMNLPAE